MKTFILLVSDTIRVEQTASDHLADLGMYILAIIFLVAILRFFFNRDKKNR
jgi:hypothetical protein